MYKQLIMGCNLCAFIFFGKIRHVTVLMFGFWLMITPAFAQDEYGCEESSNKKALKLFNEALALPAYQSKMQYDLLLETVKIDPEFVQAWYLLADYNRKKAETASPEALPTYRKRAVNHYLKVIEICPAYDRYFSLFYLGFYHFELKEKDKALRYFNDYLAKVDNGTEAEQARKMSADLTAYFDLINNPVPFEPKIVSGVSSGKDEFLPMLSTDGDFIFYTHRFDAYDKYTTIQKQEEQFTIARRTGEEGSLVYEKGHKMPFPFNQGHTQGASSITIDNNHIFITLCDFVRGYGQPYNNCDIYSSDFINGEWTPFRNLGPNVNRESTWESQPSISPDGKTLYFASIREENIGGNQGAFTSDIYRSHLGKDGNWSKAENLGLTVNTPYNEKSPFIHSDNTTLYFASDGRIGVGGYDIYYTRMENDGKWAEPENIGYPINTEGDDLGLIVSRDGTRAFFSSNKLSGQGGWDIYSFELHSAAKPDSVLFVKGELVDDWGQPVQDASVRITSSDGSRVMEGMVDKQTGKYAVAISYQKEDDFLMVVDREDYIFTSKYIATREEAQINRPMEVKFEMKPLKVGTQVELKDILFATNSADFDAGSMLVLKEFAAFLQKNPSVVIAIQGHTDNVGGEAFNLELSERRANAVENYLIERGISPTRMSSKGFGLSRPVMTNDTEEGRSRNRRTEFVIVKK